MRQIENVVREANGLATLPEIEVEAPEQGTDAETPGQEESSEDGE